MEMKCYYSVFYNFYNLINLPYIAPSSIIWLRKPDGGMIFGRLRRKADRDLFLRLKALFLRLKDYLKDLV